MSDSITTVVSKEWKQRMLLIVAVLAGSALWFLFDGLVTYPKENVKYQSYTALQEQHGKDTQAFEEAWTAARKANNWNPEVPKKFHTPGDITTQLALGGLLVLGAIAAGLHYFRGLGPTLRMEGKVILLPDGRKIPLEQIRAFSKRRWENKGIADLAYEPEPGKLGKFILDDYKFIGAADILARVEADLASRQK